MYPVRYEADYVEPQNRAKTFFRWILVIPWLIVGSIYGPSPIVAILAWFAMLFTGRYPQGLYRFHAGFLRFPARSATRSSRPTSGRPSASRTTPPTRSAWRWIRRSPATTGGRPPSA